jgi:integrase
MNAVKPIKDKALIRKMKAQLTNPRDRLLFVFGLNSNLRIQDLLDLTIGEVYTKNGTPRKEIKLKENKTKKTKSFPFNRSLTRELRAYAKYIDTSDPEAPLFPSRKKGKDGRPRPISRSQAFRILDEAGQAVGIEAAPHSLRKTWAYWRFKAGVPVEQISKALNHSSVKDTLRYIGLDQEEMDELYLMINL